MHTAHGREVAAASQHPCATHPRAPAAAHLQELVKVDGAGAVLVDVGNHLQWWVQGVGRSW